MFDSAPSSPCAASCRHASERRVKKDDEAHINCPADQAAEGTTKVHAIPATRENWWAESVVTEA
jgi:hypothetical protein